MISKFRIGIRGCGGLLAWRLLGAMNGSPASSLRVSTGLYVLDPTLENFLLRLKIGGREFDRSVLPERNFLDAKTPGDLERANELAAGFMTFEDAKGMRFEDHCDAVIDTAPPGNNAGGGSRGEIDRFSGPIILQDGAYPNGRLILPPFQGEGSGKRHRLGGCILSGVVPVLAPFLSQLQAVRLFVVMQYDKAEKDFLIRERLTSIAFEPNYPQRLDTELGVLMPTVQFDTVGVTQIPGLLHYGITFDLALTSAPSRDEVISALKKMPHVRVLPSGVVNTYQVNMVEREGVKLPPIMVVEDSVQVRGNNLRLVAFLGYRMAAVYPNIDALRIVLKGIDPLEAMRETDRELGLA